MFAEAAIAHGIANERGAPSDALRILIVDGDVYAADSLARMLQASGHPEPRVAYSGVRALAVAAEFRPTVVLLNLSLPDISGFEVARLLCQDQHWLQGSRLIALTNSSEHGDREHAAAARFERYLVKPVSASALNELLATSSRMTTPPSLPSVARTLSGPQ